MSHLHIVVELRHWTNNYHDRNEPLLLSVSR